MVNPIEIILIPTIMIIIGYALKRNNVLNAGVDVNGFRPVTFDELVENTRKFKALHATRGKPV